MELTDKYINLFTDFGFKKIFGTQTNKALLIHFLNAVLGKEISAPICDIKYGKNEFLSKNARERKAIYDIYCQDERGEHFIIELQNGRQDFFKDRSVFYASYVIQEQGKRGSWNYELVPVYVVAIMNFEFDDSASEKVISYVHLREKDSQQPFYDKLTLVYIEMPKFLKEIHELDTLLDKWLYVFKNMHCLDKIPSETQEQVFLNLFNQCEIAKYSPKEAMKYKESWKIYNDNNNVMNYAIAQAEKVATERGFENGFEKGMESGFENGLEKGIEQEKEKSLQKQKEQALTFATLMLQHSQMPDNEIAEATGLTTKEIQAIRKKLKK
jgi:predicted transposase/invertase (TIGR01784 family)